jgi:hypothetical protein
VVLHPMKPEILPPRFDFIDATGAQVGTDGHFSIMTFGFQVVPQSHGFAILDGYEGGMGDYGVMLDDDRGGHRGYGPNGYALVPLAHGDVGVLEFSGLPDCGQQSHLLLHRVADDASGPAGAPTDLGCYLERPVVLLAGNGSGSVLVLVPRADEDQPAWQMLWMDDALHVLQRFAVPELSGSAAVDRIGVLIDGSFVLRIDGHWTYRILPGATSVEAAPCWLASRPGTEIVTIRAGTAYAALHAEREECDRVVEVLTAEGRTCGFTALDGASGPCELALGRDGTLSRSAEVINRGSGEPRTCALKYWPAALGPTGP